MDDALDTDIRLALAKQDEIALMERATYVRAEFGAKLIDFRPACDGTAFVANLQDKHSRECRIVHTVGRADIARDLAKVFFGVSRQA